jgi:hypothetical protein
MSPSALWIEVQIAPLFIMIDEVAHDPVPKQVFAEPRAAPDHLPEFHW